jgi:hypothetical protein
MTRKSKARRERNVDLEERAKRAIVKLDHDTYVRAMWHMFGEHFDVMGWMYRPKGKPWDIGYRFRHYKDDRAFDSADEKSVYRIGPKDQSDMSELSEQEQEQIIAAFDHVFSTLCEIQRRTWPLATWERIDVKGSGTDAGLQLQLRKWAHMYTPGQTNDPNKSNRGAT